MLKQLCDLSNIKSETVVGYAKIYNYDVANGIIKDANHKWNVVFLDNKWQIVDVTQVANYFESNYNYIIKKGKIKYISRKPEIFVLSHFPNESKWQLLQKTILDNQFFSLEWDTKRIAFTELLIDERFGDFINENNRRLPPLK